MKKILIVAILTVFTLSAMAQRGGAPNWLSIAAKVGYGTSFLMSKQITDNENITTNYLAPSFSVGGRLGVVFIDKIGVSVEYLSSQYQNKFEYDTHINNGSLLNQNIKFKTGDLLILARYTGEYGFYAEIGPKITSVKKVDRESDLEFIGITKETDISNQFKSKFNSFVFGFGFTPYNGDRVLVSLGIRAAYCGSNVIEDEKYIFGNKVTINTLEMKPFSVQGILDINYHFARFGQATCGKQRIIFFK